MFERGDSTYVNQTGEFIAKQRSTAIRYLVENAMELRSMADETAEPEWTDEQLDALAREKLASARTRCHPTIVAPARCALRW